MKISFFCSNPACAKQLSVEDSFAGKKGRCPHCGTVQKIPAGADQPADAQLEPRVHADVQQTKPQAPAPAGPAAPPANPPWAPRTGRIVGEAKRRPMEPLKPFTPKKG